VNNKIYRKVSDFKQDRNEGNIGESLLADFARSKGYKVESSPKGQVIHYDLILSKRGKTLLVEVKTDFHSEFTGNAYIELGNKHKKESGLSTSLANRYWIYLPYNNSFLNVDVEKLKLLIKSKNFIQVFEPTFAVLIPLAEIRKIAKEYKL